MLQEQRSRVAPPSWATMYPGTRHQGKSPRNENATLTAGLRCTPDTLPINKMIAITINAGALTAAVRLIVPGKA